jgi:protein-S-isoprenylcysteine O-methyltransferase Ste14
MKATRIEFKLRVWIITALYILGFLAPWQYLTSWQHLASALQGPRLWSWLALQLFATHWLTSQQAFVAVLIAAIALAIGGAALRLAGTAHLGTQTTQAATPQAASTSSHQIVATGPYRFIRNPLYLGTWLTAIAVSLLMPFTGALVFFAALAIFELRLIAAEESYLTSHHPEAYLTYRTQTGRLLPRLRRRPPPAINIAKANPRGEDTETATAEHSATQTTHPRNHARWLEALAAEIFPIGVALTVTTFGWTYDAPLLTRAIIISFGASLIARALLPSK